MAPTPKRTPAKGKGRTQNTAKGCSCKRSQCIKNYCDCYQSMMVCSEFCRCVDCRNTEERTAVEPRTPSRNSNGIKRDRAAAMNAKAAAAKEGFNIPVPSISNVSMPAAMSPMNIIGLAPDTFNAALEQAATEQFMPLEDPETDEVTTTPDEANGLQSPEEVAKVMEPLDTEVHETQNLFTPSVNRAVLRCALIQGCEAEEAGLEHYQVGRLAIIEFANCYKEICEKILNM